MADRLFNPPEGSLEQRVVSAYGSITFGATGAVASFDGIGVSSVVRNSAGNYTITLEDSYNKFLHWNGSLLDTADSDPQTVGTDPRVDSESISSGSFDIQFYNYTDGSAADPASGAKITWRGDFRNSTVDGQ